jgi:nitrogen fixation-related uncharacterized protein
MKDSTTKTEEKQSLTVNALLFALLALAIGLGSLMWSQHGQYHDQQEMGWMGQDNLQLMGEHSYKSHK